MIIRDGAVVNGKVSVEAPPSPPGELEEIATLTRQEEATDL